MGCAEAPWTGSLVLKQSAIEVVIDEEDARGNEEYDADAPPDVLAVLTDGVDRQLKTMQAVLKSKMSAEGKVFVCGLAGDFCVRDTCINAKALDFERVAIVVDATRYRPGPGEGGREGSGVQGWRWGQVGHRSDMQTLA
jgi:nicotinamidase-related amidase